jgi:translocation and assembly module TamB
VARFNANPSGPEMPVLASILRTARLELPIRGTLDNPKIDAEAIKERLKSLGPDLVGGSIAAGADGLLQLLQGLSARRQARMAAPGADQPDRPAMMAPEERRNLREERRQERLEKKAERRVRRGLPPE